jgi:hypothetical protein
MYNEQMADDVARELTKLWATVNGAALRAYLVDSYGVETTAISPCVALHVLQAANGNIDQDVLSGAVKEYWNIDNRGLRKGYEPFDPQEGDGVLYRHPVCKFYCENESILLSERLGPGLLCRKLGGLRFGPNVVTVHDLSVRWRMSPNKAFCVNVVPPQEPVLPSAPPVSPGNGPSDGSER